MLKRLQPEASAIDVCWGIYILWKNKKPLKKEDIAAEAHCSVFFVDECLTQDHGLMELFRNAQAGHGYVYSFA